MNLQKDLIQHAAVLADAPGFLNFAQRRSSEVLHVGLEETGLLLRDCLKVLAVEETGGEADAFCAARSASPVLEPYADAFQAAYAGIERLARTWWDDSRRAQEDVDGVIGPLSHFLGDEHWYEVDRASLIRFPNGTFYRECSPVCVSFMPNWQCASLFFTPQVCRWVEEALGRRFGMEARAVPVREFQPPEDYLWRGRTYAPQSPQSLINYWAAMLPGARGSRIRQLACQQRA